MVGGAHGERERPGRGSGGKAPEAERLLSFNIPRIVKIYVVFCILQCFEFHERFMETMMRHLTRRTFIK